MDVTAYCNTNLNEGVVAVLLKTSNQQINDRKLHQHLHTSTKLGLSDTVVAQ